MDSSESSNTNKFYGSNASIPFMKPRMKETRKQVTFSASDSESDSEYLEASKNMPLDLLSGPDVTPANDPKSSEVQPELSSGSRRRRSARIVSQQTEKEVTRPNEK